MEEKFVAAWIETRRKAADHGVRLRPFEQNAALQAAHRCLSGHRESDGFFALSQIGHLEWTLEALAVSARFTALFSDEEVNTALQRLLSAGYRF